MPAHRDPAAAARLAEHHGEALAVARRKYPGLSPDDHLDIVQEAITSVLARLQRGPLSDPRSYLLRVVYTTGAHVLTSGALASRLEPAGPAGRLRVDWRSVGQLREGPLL